MGDSRKGAAISLDELNWRKIYACCAVYVTGVVAINCRQLFRRDGFSDFAQQTSPFRPALTPHLDLGDLVHAAGIVDPSLAPLLNVTSQGDLDAASSSPCWLLNAQRHCLPAFHVLGAFQSGVRDLQTKMQMHPDIVHLRNPEPHFWSELQPVTSYLQQYTDVYDGLMGNASAVLLGDWSMSSLAGYWAMQPRAHQAFYEIKSTCKEHCVGSSTAPERSSCLTRECFEPAQRRDRERAAAAGLTYEQMQTPLLMRAAYGAAQPKFVVMLRDPVERMHSAFHSYGHYWERYGGRTPAGFERFAAEQLAGFRNCTRAERHSPFTCALYMESLSQDLDDVFFHSDQLLRGLYAIWLHLWLSHFPRESFLVVKAEDYFARPRAVLQRVLKHLGAAPPSGEGWDAILGAASIRSAATGAEMTTAARQALDEFYAPFNADLAALLGDQTWRWRS